MVAVVAGNGLGLFNTSLTALGGLQGGPAGLGGRAGSQVVNIADGNLILQDQDESLSVRGFSADLLRTYNSRGTVGDTGQDGWETGFERRVESTYERQVHPRMMVHSGDGSVQYFSWVATGYYESKDGSGAHDSLAWRADTSTWTYLEGSTGRQETFAAHSDPALRGRLLSIRQPRSDGTTPAEFQVFYDADARVSEIRSVDGAGTNADAILYVYDKNDRLASITTREGGITKTQVSYGYDSYGRLEWAQQDLTPTITTDNTWDLSNDSLRHRTAYTYVTADASDLRIASVTQSDGQTVSYTYESDGYGGYRVKTVTQGSVAEGSAQTVTFTYNTGSTDVTDGLNRSWTYQYDSYQRLTAILAPAVNGQRDTTTYIYDGDGNVTQVKNVSGATILSQTDQLFDSRGNVLRQWTRVNGADAAAYVVERKYTKANQVDSETRYTGLDADGTGPDQAPSGGLTSYFVYDDQQRLRFTVDATGAVTEHSYATSGNGVGQLANSRTYLGATYAAAMYEPDLSVWAAAQKANSQLVEFTYDSKGRLQQTVSFASVDSSGAGVSNDAANDITSYLYDAQGLLLQKVAVRGVGRSTTYTANPLAGSELTSYVYDGMGRLLSMLKRDSSSSASNDALTVSTTYAYADSTRQVVVTMDSSATQTETRNQAGQITSMVESGTVSGSPVTRTTQNFYDAAGQLRGRQDASGARRYFFYDAKSRLEAEVDATGAVTRYIYDGADRRLSTVQYANRVTTGTWLTGSTVGITKLIYQPTAPTLNPGEAWVPSDAANDRSSVRTFDLAGRVVTQTNAAGGTDRQITSYTYDGAGRLAQSRTSDSIGTVATARLTRQFYDAAGRLQATLDAERYLILHAYDPAGRLIRTTRYATKIDTPVTIDENTALSALVVVVDAAKDQSSRYFYNGRGQQIGTLDAQGYLSESIIDEAGNTRAERRYAKQLTGLNGTESFSTLKTAATVTPPLPTERYRENKSSYNGLGQLATQTNHEGTVTRFTYDEVGRLVRTQAAENTTEVREDFSRYNVFGELIGEISGKQVSDATTMLGGRLLTDPTLTEADLNAAYNAYGMTHSYDALGRRTETRDAEGNKTFHFYDTEGRLTFTVKGVAEDNAGVTGVRNSFGEVTETRYSAFGQVGETRTYTGRITIAAPYDRASVQNAINVLTFVAATDTRRQFMYDQRGLLKQSVDALNVSSTYNYTAFGQLFQEQRAVGNSAAITVQHAYDKRGLETGHTDAVGTAVVRNTSKGYDAFGRVISSTDARGATTTLFYDRLGRQVTRSLNVTSEGILRTEQSTSTYDAFGRVLTLTDAIGNTTTYAYSDANRSIKVTSQEGVEVTTVHNRHGQTLTVTEGSNPPTTYAYDKNGAVVSIQQPGIGSTSVNEYDVRGMLLESTDASGRKVRYSYDAIGRVLSRSEDPAGLNLVTKTNFDGQGRQVKVTDATGRITTMSYDQEGRLFETIQDPGAGKLNLTTRYTHDAAGRQLTVTEGYGSTAARTTQYVYDALGRRTQERLDPTGLNLTTSYLYDANDNVVQRTDATGNVTRFVYDEADRRIFDIDATGGVTKTTYDADGRVVAMRSYATAINVSDLPTTAGVAASTIKARVDQIANEAIDQQSYRVYDRDSRVRYSVSHLSGTVASVTETRYDIIGRVLETLQFSQAITLSAALKTKLRTGDTTASADILALLTDYVAWSSGFDGNSLAGFTVPDGIIAPTMNGDRVVFDRNPNLNGYTGFRRNDLQSLSQNLTFRAEFSTEGSVNGTYVMFGIQNEVPYASAGFRREAIFIQDGHVQKHQITNDVITTSTMTLLAPNTTYVVEMETQDGLITTYFYAKGSDRNSGVSFSAASSAASFGNNYLFAVGLYEPGKSGVPIYMDNVSATQRQNPQRNANVYDAAGRMRFDVDALGNVTEQCYDAAGRRVQSIAYVSTLTDATLLAKVRNGTATPADFSAFVIANDAGAQRTSLAYDAAGRARFIVDALGDVTEQRYDAVGRVAETRKYPKAIALNTWLNAMLRSGDDRSCGVIEGQLQSQLQDPQRQTNVFDAAGRARYIIDALGTVSESKFDASGLVIAQRVYAQSIIISPALRLKLDAGTATVGDISALLSADNARDRQSNVVLDAAGRQRFAVDALGNVTESRYDAAGRVVETLAYATVLPSAQLTDVRNGTATVSTFTGFVATNASSAQASKTIYDAAGRAVYTLVRSDTLSQLAVVSERRYNALDQLAADVSYGVTIAYGAGSSAASTSNAIASANGNLAQNQRMTRYVYDVNGRMRFTVDDVGAVTEQRYDAVGQVVSTRQYGTLISLASYTEATVAAAVSSQAGARVTWQSYDAAGRLVRIHDAMNQSEYYRYDGIGQRVSMSNKLGYRWDYEFDLAGRLVTETSPWIAIARFDATGAFVANEGGATITRTAYDALGNVVSRTENADAANILDRRTTLYQYDNRGNQIRVVFPDAYRIDEASNLLVASNTTPTIEITYDALGRAVVQKDVRGNYSYKVYDQLGRVVFDIDAEGYASGYVYTVLSVGGAYTETTNLRRYSTKINTSGIAGWVPGAALTSAQLLGGALTASASDRFLVTTHDARGLKTKVEQSAVSYVSTASQGSGIASPTTRFEYDAYGQLVKESVQIDATTWANTFHYYDDLGRKRLSVDAEGYVTAWEYNAQGEVVVSVEFARCIDTSTLSVGTIPPLPMAGNDITGYDRGVSYTYDALGRKTSETANRLYQSADGSNARRAFVTSYQYDAASQTTATIVDGQRTDYAYDPLGRTITVTEAARQVLADNWSALLAGDINKNLTSAGLYVNASPYTSMSYDAFGNVVQLTRAALGLRSGEYFPTPNANDQITLTRYDRQGRAVYSRNAVGDITVTSYDEADNVKSTLSTLTDSDFATVKVRTSYTYDKSGRQLSMVVQREGTINGAANQIAIDSSEYVAYNGYGEIIAKSNASANLTNSALSAQYEYDLAGRIIRSNAEGGVFRRYFYNLAGHQQREERDLSGSGMATTTQRTDLLGRVQQMVMPAYGDNIPSLPTLTRRYDRWGNVIEQIDPRGYSTQVLYNDRNQVVREVAPLVKVLSEAGVESWVRTETRYSYDASGRLIATRDANGNVDYTQYDAAGRVMKTIDSVGAATLQAYDALGRSLLMQNPLGYLTFKSYDRLSRVVAQGDLLSNLAGTGRDSEALQSFTLNQRGDRTRVTVRTSDTVNNTQRYDFDSRGLLLRSRSAQTLANNAQAPGVTTSFAYDAQGRKTSETNGIVVAQSWNYDYFGRLSSHVDLSNKTHSYVYDARSGLLSSQSSTWDTSTTVSVPGGREPGSAPDLTDLADNRSISYYANGLIKRIDEPSGIYYRYEYDAAGNRTLEETKTYDGRGFLINRRTQTIYDSHGRVSRITEDTFDAANGAWTRVLDMSYDYDAVGNRRRVTANSGYGPVNAPLGSVNLAPVLVGSAQAVFLKAGAPVQWRLPVGSMFRDPEGKPLSINVSLSNGAALPSWLTVDTSVSGEIQFVASSGSSASLGQTFAVRVSAVDDAGAGATVSTSFNISVVSNSAPTTVTPGVSTIQLHSGLSFDKTLLASSFFADREMGDKLSLSVDSVSPWASWLSIDMSSPQQLRIRGTAPAPSSTTIRVRATDQNGASVVKDIVLQTQNNVAPAVAQSFTTQEASLGRAFVFSRPLEQVFTDANADLLTVSASLSNGAALPAWLSFEGIDNPPTLRLVGVVPPNEVVGTQYQVRLTASDGFGGSVSTIVTVAIVTNRAPTVIASLPAQNVAQLGQVDLTFSVAAYVWEPDGNDFTMTRDPSSPSWLYLSRDAAAGTFRIYGGVPGNTPAGSYVFNIQVADAEGATTLMPITINVSTSHAPVYTPGSIPATLSYPAGQAFSYTLPANAFTDADAGQILTYSAVGREWFADPDGNNSGWIDIDLPPGVVFNGSTLSGTPSDAKSYLIAFRATDPTGQTETSPNINFNVTQTSANVPPTVANAIPSQSAEMNSPFSYTIPANTFIDGDNDPLTYSASNLPGEVSFNPDTRVVSGVFTLVGSQSIIITANDGRGGMASTTLVVNVTNADANVPPRVNVPLEDQSVYIGDSISYTIPANSFVDDNGDALTYTATGMPSWFVFDPSTRRFSGVSRIGEGEWVITVTVTDGRGGSASDAFMLYTFNPNVISEAIEPPVQKFESLAMVVEGPPEMPPEMPPEDPTPDAILLAGYADGGIQVVTAIANVTVPVTTYTVGMGVNRQEHWYTYDAENRVVISQGALKDIDGAGPQAPRIVLGDFGSHEQRYDVIGQMVALVQYGTVARTQFNLRGQRVSESAPLPFADSGVAPLERREFDDAGRVTQVKRYYAPGSSLLLSGSEQPAVYGNAAGLLLSAESYTYDLDGRVKEQVQSSRVANWQNDIDIPLTTFNSDATFRANQTNNLNVLTQVATVKYTLANNTTSSYDAAGRLLSYRFIVSPTPNQSGSGYTHTFSYTYEARDSYLEKSVTGVRDNMTGTTTSYYDAYGRRVAIQEVNTSNQTIPKLRYFSYNADGQILSRRDGNGSSSDPGYFVQYGGSGAPFTPPGELPEYPENPIPHIVSDETWTGQTVNGVPGYTNADRAAVLKQQLTHRYHYANGQQIAETTQSGQLEVVRFLTSFSSSAMGTQSITVQSGDTLQAIAQRAYGNSSLWYVIASANGVTDAELVEGTQLKVPEVKTNLNDAATFKPYDPSEISGPTTPTLPFVAPPAPNSCLMVVVVIVAIIVTIYTAGAAAGLLGATGTVAGGASTAAIGGAALTGTGLTVATGATVAGLTAGQIAVASAAIGAFVGSVASQLVGKALGVVDHFSLRQATASGLTAGITAGVGSAGFIQKIAESATYGHIAAGAVSSATSAVTSYAANRIAGVDTSFSWKSIAASAVSGAVTAGIGAALPITNTFGKELANRLIGGVVGLHARRAFGFDDPVNYESVAADAFGNALGNAAVRGIQNWWANRLASQGSFLDRYPQATASGYGEQRGLFASEPDTMSTDGSVVYGEGHTRRATDEELYQWQADIDALSAQGRDMTVAQQALDEMWTRRYAELGIPMLEPVTVVGNVTSAAGDTGANAADASLMWLHSQFENLRSTSRDNILNANSAPEAMLASGVYAVNEVTSAVASGFVDVGRLITSPQMRADAWRGLKAIAAHPIDGLGNAWKAWQDLPPEERLRQGGAMLATLGTGAITGPSKLGTAARVTDEVSTLVARETEALAEIAARNATAEAKSLHARINARAPNTSVETTQPTAAKPHFRKFSFDNVDDFNRAANKALPNSRYEFGGNVWITDSKGRVARIEASALLKAHGRHETIGEISARQIGHEGTAGDIGFHLFADQFGGPVNRLNVVPGNGRAETLPDGTVLKNLNGSDYKVRFENRVAEIGRATEKPVAVKIEPGYLPGNFGSRPDIISASYQLRSGKWVVVRFNNKAGG